MLLFLDFGAFPWISIYRLLYVTSLLTHVHTMTSMRWHPGTQILQRALAGTVVVSGTHSMSGLEKLPGDSD